MLWPLQPSSRANRVSLPRFGVSVRQVGDTERRMPLVFFWNIDNHHWNVIRVVFEPFPAIELFEPMGYVQNEVLSCWRRRVHASSHAFVAQSVPVNP